MSSIKSRINSLVLLSVFGLLSVVVTFSWQSFKDVQKQTHAQLEHIVEASIKILEMQHGRVLAGEISEVQAKKESLDVLAAVRYRNSNYVFVSDTEHILLMHPIEVQWNGAFVGDFQDPEGNLVSHQWVDAALSGEHVFKYVATDTINNEVNNKVGYATYFEPWDMVVVTSALEKELNVALGKLALEAVIFLIVIGGVVGGIGLKIASSIVSPLTSLARSMDKLSDGDVNAEVTGIDRKDEIGPMAKAVVAFQNNLVERQRLENKTTETEQILTRRQRRVDQLISAFQNEANNDFQEMSKHANELKHSSEKLLKSAAETDDKSTRASEVSNDTSTNVQTVAAAAEELSASVAEIHGNVQTNYDTIVQTSEKSKTANVQVRELAEAVAQISDVVDLIADIAEQTNLLALNATIEAARAGDAGKGFAVVATEVKQLADQTARATNQIGGQINLVQGSTEQTVTSIENVTNSMERVLSAMQEISSAVEEQGAATNEISRNASYAAQGTQEVVENSRSVTEVAQSTNSSAISVESVSDELSRKTEQMQNRVDAFLKDVAEA